MSVWSRFGDALGIAYFVWSLGLFFGCLLGHHLLLAIYAATHRASRNSFHPFAEIVFAGINPFVYLVVYEPALFRSATPGWALKFSWAALISYWVLRLSGDSLPLPR